MDEITLEFQKRDVTGKAVKHVRGAGAVPAVIHDHGKASHVVQVDYQLMAKAYHAAGRHHPVKLNGDGHKFTALIKTITFDPKRNSISHVVFGAVAANEKVEAAIPVHAQFDEGNDQSPAERAGLIVLHNTETVEVEAVPKDLPDVLKFDAEKLLLAVGDHATAGDLIIPKGVTLKTDPATVLATVFEPSALQAANDAAGGDADEAEVVAEDAEAEVAESQAAVEEKKES